MLDEWFEYTVKPRLRGQAHLIRYADDFIMVFENESDARRVMSVLPKRFAKYGLAIHPDKTKLIDFRRPTGEGSGQRDQTVHTFDLLGFTHYWARSRRGSWVVKRKTTSKRLTRAVQRIIAELEADGYLSHTRNGRNNHYTVHTDLPLRHPVEQHCGVSGLIEMTLMGSRASPAH